MGDESHFSYKRTEILVCLDPDFDKVVGVSECISVLEGFKQNGLLKILAYLSVKNIFSYLLRDFGKTGKYEAYLVDEDHDGELICTTEELEFDLKRNSILLIKEI